TSPRTWLPLWGGSRTPRAPWSATTSWREPAPSTKPLAMRRIATVNVNGIRAAHRRGFGDWLTTRGSNVIALQEVRAQADKLPAAAFGCYHVAFDPGSLPGRNGVAVLTRQEPAAIRTWNGTALAAGPQRRGELGGGRGDSGIGYVAEHERGALGRSPRRSGRGTAPPSRQARSAEVICAAAGRTAASAPWRRPIASPSREVWRSSSPRGATSRSIWRTHLSPSPVCTCPKAVC